MTVVHLKYNHFTVDATCLRCREHEVAGALPPLIDAKLKLQRGELLGCRILNSAVDARRGRPEYVFSLILELDALTAEKLQEQVPELTEWVPAPEVNVRDFRPERIAEIGRVIVVGAGPAGLFAAWYLAQAGCPVTVLERGFDVERREKDIARFHTTREMNPESNYLFGEGGAGTFSDGKLYTRIRDPHASLILRLFIDCGAAPEIAYQKRPHLGSDRLPGMIKNLREKISRMGGTFRFGCKVASPLLQDGKCVGVLTAEGEEISAGAVIFAHGLGGRELTLDLVRNGVEYAMKPFQIGCRIEHPQKLVDRNQYRLPSRPEALGAAEYNFVSRADEQRKIPGVSTFCMCPGGVVVVGSGTPGQLATNGMSLAARNGEFANSALIVTLPEGKFSTPEEAYSFLTEIEKKIFDAGGKDYTFPAQDAKAFLRGDKKLTLIRSSVLTGLKPARLDLLLPGELVVAMKRALKHFDGMMHGFIAEGKLIGVESYVSSPVRFLRSKETFTTSIPGLYVSGEGAGFAGGIVSAAVDGLKTAEAILL